MVPLKLGTWQLSTSHLILPDKIKDLCKGNGSQAIRKRRRKERQWQESCKKIEETFGGKKEEQRKGEPQPGLGQQGHNTQGEYGQQGYNAQGEHKEGFAGNIKDKIPGGGDVGSGGMHKGETQGGYVQQGYNTQGGYGQQKYNVEGEHKEGIIDKIKDKISGGGGGMHKGETQGGYGPTRAQRSR
ncbi:hypothetical protein OIU79_023813 [Salix purpurea]|uniref:Uncharacterized protein n=1 Tax=Salix purpurea TaxID=77065 RepID=A0A9Q0W9Z1_SALPP|nr:hypothetical protein OIU79_023813 [Salix purpurea]